MDSPSKNDITAIFKRLRSIPANKVCFDCHSKNPTWSSVTYGIFICIDCSGIHRSLGVHLTFVRSTQLDSNWSWLQLRQMQLGGNANASAFFRQQNCTTTDTQVKYKSRAAQLYREKLHNSAVSAMKLHGTKVFIDAPQNSASKDDDVDKNEAEEDFFDQQHEEEKNRNSQEDLTAGTFVKRNTAAVNIKNGNNNDDGAAPSVEAALSTSPTSAQMKAATRKSTIGGRKPAAKKGLGGVKKGGLGATKVKKDFAEIEREAEMADQMRSKMAEEEASLAIKAEEDSAKKEASMRLAYQDISVQQKKQEEKLKKVDPKKAAQVERLGMGFKSASVGKNGGISHSLMSDMDVITQEEPSFKSNSRGKSRFDVDYDDNDDDNDRYMDRYEKNSGKDNGNSFSGFGGGGGGSWENEFERMKLENNTKSSSSYSSKPKNNTDDWSNSFEDNSSSRGSDYYNKSKRPDTLNTGVTSSEDIVKKYGAAKAISSDMVFGNDTNGGSDANLNRFQGSNSISSAEYFNRTEVTPGSRIQSPDMDDVKESVRQGVSKVAGKLSGMASGVMNQLQERYGY